MFAQSRHTDLPLPDLWEKAHDDIDPAFITLDEIDLRQR